MSRLSIRRVWIDRHARFSRIYREMKGAWHNICRTVTRAKVQQRFIDDNLDCWLVFLEITTSAEWVFFCGLAESDSFRSPRPSIGECVVIACNSHSNVLSTLKGLDWGGNFCVPFSRQMLFEASGFRSHLKFRLLTLAALHLTAHTVESGI